MFPVALRQKNIGDCRPESHRRRHPHVPRVEKRLPPGRNAHDKSFVDAAQPVAGRCLPQCLHANRRGPTACRTARCRRPACGRARASAGVAVDRTPRRQRSRRQARAECAAADTRGAGQAADGEAQSAGRLQHRGLCRGHGECALARRGRQGHGVRRQPPGRQGLCHRQQGRQARGQGAGLRPLPAERRRLQGRHALHRRTVEDLQDREGRRQSG